MTRCLLDHEVSFLQRDTTLVNNQRELAVENEVEVDRPCRVETLIVNTGMLLMASLGGGKQRCKHPARPAAGLGSDPVGCDLRIDRLDPIQDVARLVIPHDVRLRRVELVDRYDVRSPLLVDAGNDAFHSLFSSCRENASIGSPPC